MQIWMDILRTIHFSAKNRRHLTSYRLERATGLTSTRLRRFLRDLRNAELLDENLVITERGYAFLSEMTGKVMPVLDKYGLWEGGT